MSTPEGRVKTYVKRRMRECWPACYQFCPVQNGLGAPSLDFLYCIHGRWLAIETKAPGKKPTPRQLVTMREIQNAGGQVWIVDSPSKLDAYILATGPNFDTVNL